MSSTSLYSSIIKSQKVHYCEKSNDTVKKIPMQIPQQEVLEVENFTIQIKRHKDAICSLDIICGCGRNVTLEFSYLEQEPHV